jgi:hypothetical protein
MQFSSSIRGLAFAWATSVLVAACGSNGVGGTVDRRQAASEAICSRHFHLDLGVPAPVRPDAVSEGLAPCRTLRHHVPRP